MTASLLQKAWSFASKPNESTFPELTTVVTWLRLIIGAAYGVSLGMRNENKGIIGATLGLNVIAFLPMIYFAGYLQADVDSYKNLRFVGVANGLAIMFLIWITYFTWAHSEEETSIQKILSDIITPSAEATVDYSTEEFVNYSTEEVVDYSTEEVMNYATEEVADEF